MNNFFKLSIVLTILVLLGAGIYPVQRQYKINKALAQLTSQNPDVRNSAVSALGKLGAKEAITNIIKLLEVSPPRTGAG
ncbi:MAG: hypothetical protein V1701_00535 [Planctomycetota bacterium]